VALSNRRKSKLLTKPAVWRDHNMDDGTLYGVLRWCSPSWFRDEDFFDMYRSGGRPSVPPSILAMALVLQRCDGLSDRELVRRIQHDLRYQYALNVPPHYRGFHPSLLSVFRRRLIESGLDGFVSTQVAKLAQRCEGLSRGNWVEPQADR
jgi:hypothetical protein